MRICLLCPDNPLMNASRQVVELVGEELVQAEPAKLLTVLEEPLELLEELPELLEELPELLDELPEVLEEPPELLARNAAICITHQLEGLWVELAL